MASAKTRVEAASYHTFHSIIARSARLKKWTLYARNAAARTRLKGLTLRAAGHRRDQRDEAERGQRGACEAGIFPAVAQDRPIAMVKPG